MKITINIPKINPWMTISLVLAIALVVVLFYQQKPQITGALVLSKDEVGKKVIDYINSNLVQTGQVALVSVEDMGTFYKILTSYQGQQIPVYVTKDGKYLFLSQPLDTSKEIPKEEVEERPQQEEVDWSLFETSLPENLKNKILGFVYEQPVQIEDRIQEFKNYPECEGNIIVFYFEWCGWCKRYHPVLVEAREDYPSITFYTLDLEKNQDIGNKFGVRGTPATVINCKYLISGYLPKESLYPILDKYSK